MPYGNAYHRPRGLARPRGRVQREHPTFSSFPTFSSSPTFIFYLIFYLDFLPLFSTSIFYPCLFSISIFYPYFQPLFSTRVFYLYLLPLFFVCAQLRVAGVELEAMRDPEYSRANSYPCSHFSPRRARPGPGPHTA